MPGTYNLTINKGETFTVTFTWKDEDGNAINLTGYTARMMIKETFSSSAAIVSLTSPSGGIVLGGAAGTIAVTIADTVTTAIIPSHGVYDLELVSSGGVVTRLMQGDVSFTSEVTK